MKPFVRKCRFCNKWEVCWEDYWTEHRTWREAIDEALSSHVQAFTLPGAFAVK